MRVPLHSGQLKQVFSCRMGNTFEFFFLAFAGLFICVCGSPRDDEIVPQDYLRWNFTKMNPNCSYVDKNTVCKDIRICRSGVASLTMSGWPALCGWVGEGVPKVCCGLPLVLGKKLMEKMDAEIARKRGCGTRNFESNLSETENKFLEIWDSLKPFIDSGNPDPDMFDPPLSETVRGPPKPDYPVGGKPTRQGYFSFMVSIRKAGKHWCAGTLIDRKHILSAAHCFVTDSRELDTSEYIVHVGNLYVDEGFPFNVRKIVVHPLYQSPSFYHDLAILTLREEILSPQVAHVCLPSPDLAAKNLTGENTTLIGWGHTLYGNPTSSLHIADNLPVLPFNDCKTAYRTVSASNLPEGLTEDFMCTGLMVEDDKNACHQMDSGAPLLYTSDPRVRYYIHADIPWTQVGVVSFRFRCNEPGFPKVYTKVANYMDWITKTMNE